MISLEGQVALVTGASRGVGRGVATALAELGLRVFATGRTIDRSDLRADVTRFVCDHTDDAAVGSVFDRLREQTGRLDILVNSAWSGYERMVEDGRFTWGQPFWDQPRWRWDAMMNGGVRAAFVASQFAARMMVPARSGLIANVSHWSAQKHIGNVPYGVAKAATDKLTRDCAHELQPHNVTVVSLYPGLVRTEAVLAAGVFDLSNSESPEFAGRAIAAVRSDADALNMSGSVLVTADLGRKYGFTDTDGRRPVPLSLKDV
jgi:dehydrogenase/reductase SDR family member 1